MIRSSLTALAGLMIAAGTVGSASAGATPAPAPQFWSNANAGPGSLTMDASRVSAITGIANLTVVASNPRLTDSSARVAPSDCLNAWRPGQQQSYAGRPWTATLTTMLADGKAEDAQHIVQDSLVQFSSPADARRYFQEASMGWDACTQRVVMVSTPAGAARPWQLGVPVRDAADTIALSQNGPSARCERAMGVKADTIIDVLVCSTIDDPAGHGAALVNAITTGPTP
jgi:hypothetical protein